MHFSKTKSYAKHVNLQIKTRKSKFQQNNANWSKIFLKKPKDFWTSKVANFLLWKLKSSSSQKCSSLSSVVFSRKIMKLISKFMSFFPRQFFTFGPQKCPCFYRKFLKSIWNFLSVLVELYSRFFYLQCALLNRCRF